MSFKKITTLLFAAAALNPLVTFAGAAEDTAITAAVKAQLITEKDIPASNIEVTTKDGVVWLKGMLDTGLQADRAIEVASSVDNVDNVDNSQLKTKDSKSYTTDSTVTLRAIGKIRSLSMRNIITSGHDLHVETTNGEVHIHGTVKNAADVDAIVKEVQAMKGVKSVKQDIKPKA